MTVLFAVILVVHGLLHLLGFAKAFGLAELPQLTRPISQLAGTLWLIAALLFLAAAVALFLWPRWWWLIGAAAVVISLSVILPSWADAKFGVLANLVVLVGVVFGFLAYGPMSLRGAYDVVAASGSEMNQGETVTLFNDMCVMAPATLIGAGIVWEPVDRNMARATFSNAGHTIRAELSFNDRGELTNFQSNERYQTSPDGKSVRQLPWSTPLDGYRSFGSVRLAGSGEARWRDAAGEFTYIELTFDDIDYNVTSRGRNF